MYVATPTRTFLASAALAIYRRVKLDANGKLEYAGATDTDCIGITANNAFAADEPVAVWLLSAQGTFPVTAAGTFLNAATLYAAADGKVDDSGTVLHGVALHAATAVGERVEALVSPAAIIGSIARSALVQDDLQPYRIPVAELRVWDAPSTPAVAATAAADDLAVVDNTFGTAAPTVETGDLKTAGATTRKVRFMFPVPPEYVAGQTITLRANAGMKTTVADGSAAIDFEVVRQGCARHRRLRHRRAVDQRPDSR